MAHFDDSDEEEERNKKNKKVAQKPTTNERTQSQVSIQEEPTV